MQRFARHYGYDAAGRRNYMSYGTPASNPGGQVYAYDAQGQLTHAKFLATGNPATTVSTVNPTHQFSFDASGNRLSAVTPSLGTVNYTADNTNKYTLVTGDQPTHDANGNQTHLRGRNLSWDRRDRLRSNGNVSYTYDALGRMVKRKNTTSGVSQRFTWSGWLMISEQHKDAGGNETEFLRYTWGADLTGSLEGAGAVGGLLMIEHFAANSSTAQAAHAHADANGNIMGLTSDTGAQLAWYRYHPFGQIESQGGNADWLTWNSFTFSSKWQDAETALHYYGYRWYDAVTGRWPSRDPIEEEGGENLYGFIYNAPVGYVDFLGLKLTLFKKGDELVVDNRKDVKSGKLPILYADDGRAIAGITNPTFPTKIAICADCTLLLQGSLAVKVTYYLDAKDKFGQGTVKHENVHVQAAAELWNNIVYSWGHLDGTVYSTPADCQLTADGINDQASKTSKKFAKEAKEYDAKAY